MWRSISSATTTRARDGSATLASCTRGIVLHACQVLEQLDGTLVQIDAV